MDKRLHKRWPQQLKALVMKDGWVLEGTTFDISPSGLGLIMPEMTGTDGDISISISLPTGRQGLSAELSWSRKEADSRYRIGVKLISAPVEFLNYAAMLRYQ